MGAVKGEPQLVEKNPQPLGVILRLEEELGKGKNIVIVLFFIAVSKYVTRNMENCIFGPAHGGFTIHCLDPLGYIRPLSN